MKHRSLLLIILTIFIITFGIALSESAQTDIFSYGEWDWDNESLNAFNGSIDVSQWAGTELTLMMKAEFEPKSESASEIVPKYTHFNGKRLPMLKQSDTMTYKGRSDLKAHYKCLKRITFRRSRSFCL